MHGNAQAGCQADAGPRPAHQSPAAPARRRLIQNQQLCELGLSLLMTQGHHLLQDSSVIKTTREDLPGGPVGENPSASTGDTGSITGPERSHEPQGN